MMQHQLQREQEKQARVYRYENRKCLDELLLKILNGDLFDIFSQTTQKDFP